MAEAKNELKKNKAIEMIKSKNPEYNDYFDRAGKTITYSSKNKSADTYWATPRPDFLNHDWVLILNDFVQGKLHFFFIDAHTINEDRFKTRQYIDGSHKLHLEILYDDPDFKDRFKGYKFLPHYKATISYGEKTT